MEYVLIDELAEPYFDINNDDDDNDMEIRQETSKLPICAYCPVKGIVKSLVSNNQ